MILPGKNTLHSHFDQTTLMQRKDLSGSHIIFKNRRANYTQSEQRIWLLE